MASMKRSPAFLAGIVLILLLCASPAAAATVTESPDVVARGEPITITLAGLADNAIFSLQIDGEFLTEPGQAFVFSTNNFNMPITLNDGTISATTQNTRATTLLVKKGDTMISIGKPADASGYFSISQETTVSAGVYEYLQLRGIARADARKILSTMNLVGKKQGPTDSRIVFTIDGIDNGVVHLIALVDGAQVMYKTVTVGAGAATPTPTPVATTPVVTAETPVQYLPTTATITATTTATTAATTVPASAATPGVKTFWSADRKVSLTTDGVDYAALLMVREAEFPANWLAVTDAYTVAPDSLTFNPPATISFAIPEKAGDYAYFIGMKKSGQWLVVPSTAGSDTISADISSAATYALVAYQPESTVTATLKPQDTAAGTAAATPKGTPRIASIAQGETPAATATKAAGSMVPVACALLACAALLAGSRRR